MKKEPQPQPVNTKVKATIWLNAATWDRIRHQAIDEHTSANAIVEKALAEYVSRQTKERGK